MSEGFFTDRAAFSSKDQTWCTPKKLFEELNNEFRFTLDAAALQSSALCANWYGPDHPDETKRDCLVTDWSQDSDGAVFMNPPYGRGIGKFMWKAMMESRKGLTVVCLVPARTDTTWFHDTVFADNAQIRFLRGRLKFNDGPNSAPFPSCVVIFDHGCKKETSTIKN